MTRTSPKALRRRRWVAWIVLSVAVLIAFLVLFSPELFPKPTYDELSEKNVTVSSYEWIPQYRGGYSYRLYTDDGTFAVTGDFDHTEAATVFQKDIVVTVKWYSNSINPFLDCAEEITVNGSVIVRYDNDDPIDRIPLVLMSVLIVLCGAGYTVCSLLWTKHLQNLENKRDKRIEKKYGKKE